MCVHVGLLVCVRVFAWCVCVMLAGFGGGFLVCLCVCFLFAGVLRVVLFVLFVCMFFLSVFLLSVVVAVAAMARGAGLGLACHI